MLRSSGAGKAEVVCICIDDPEATLKIVDLVHAEFPSARTYVRVFDRIQAIEAMGRDVDYQIRETFESALAFGGPPWRRSASRPRRRPARSTTCASATSPGCVLQQAGDPLDRSDPLRSLVRIKPEPLTAPLHASHGLNPETEDIIARERAGADG